MTPPPLHFSRSKALVIRQELVVIVFRAARGDTGSAAMWSSHRQNERGPCPAQVRRGRLIGIPALCPVGRRVLFLPGEAQEAFLRAQSESPGFAPGWSAMTAPRTRKENFLSTTIRGCNSSGIGVAVFLRPAVRPSPSATRFCPGDKQPSPQAIFGRGKSH